MNLTPINYPSILAPAAIEYFDDYEAGAVEGSWGTDDVRCNRTYKVVLKAFTNSKYVGPAQIIAACPAIIGSYYQFPLTAEPTENDTGSYLRRITPTRTTEAGGLQWAVVLEYEPFDTWSLLGSSYINQGLIDPLDRAWEVYWGEPAKYRKVKYYNESGEQDDGSPGKPFLNTVGDPLLDPPDTEETRPILVIVNNKSTYDDSWASQYKDTVNSDEFLGFPPNNVKCKDIKGSQRAWDPDWGWYFRVEYQFEFDYDDDGEGFSKIIINAGYRYKPGGSGSIPVNCVDGAGQTVTDAKLLQEGGDMLPAGDPPYFITFAEFPQVEFAGLDIPDDILYVAEGNT